MLHFRRFEINRLADCKVLLVLAAVVDPRVDFAQETEARKLDDVIDGADIFLGLSVANV